MDRKQFLQAAGLTAGAGMLAACTGERAETREGAETGGAAEPGTGPDGAGNASAAAPDGTDPTLNPPLDRIGVQLYTVRSLMAEDVAASLAAVAAIGYSEVEFAGYFDHTPDEIRGMLAANGLTAPATHVGLDQVRGDALDASIASAEAIGHGWLVVPSLPESLRTPDGYREVAGILNEAGAVAASAGIRVGYHNHAFEFEPVGDDPAGPTGYSVLVDNLDPALVDLEIDLHWSAVGGADAVALFEAYPGRFPLCHVKGLSADGRMVDVGAGEIDWAGIFAHSDHAGLRHYFVEHDQPDDALASIEASYRYLSAT